MYGALHKLWLSKLRNLTYPYWMQKEKAGKFPNFSNRPLPHFWLLGLIKLVSLLHRLLHALHILWTALGWRQKLEFLWKSVNLGLIVNSYSLLLHAAIMRIIWTEANFIMYGFEKSRPLWNINGSWARQAVKIQTFLRLSSKRRKHASLNQGKGRIEPKLMKEHSMQHLNFHCTFCKRVL